MQHQNDLLNAKRPNNDPREAILSDLTLAIKKVQEQGHDTIVLGDTNEDVYKSKRIQQFLKECKMYNAIQRIHEKEGPPTYDRGSKCLDLVAISNTIAPESVVKCGYLPFYKGIFSDHRGLYIDIKAEDIFQRAAPDTNREIYKRFTTSQVVKCNKYISHLEKHITEAKLDTKTSELQLEMENYIDTGKGDVDELVRQSKVLFEKTTQVMKASERAVGRKAYKNGYSSSNTLREAAESLIQVKKELRNEKVQATKNNSRITLLEEKKTINEEKHEDCTKRS